MKHIVSYIFTSLWIVGVAIALYVAQGWNATTALFPKSVGYPMLALLAIILALDVRKTLRRKAQGDWSEEEKAFPARNKAMVLYLGWLVGFAVLVWAIGVLYAMPLYIFCYMKLQGKYGALKALLYAAATTGFIFLLFQYAFRVSWPEGALQMFLGM
jgi:hypothetical protein